MKAFKEYSLYYDLLYRDKDYQKEADYILKIIKEYNKGAKKILELGCGTGKHAKILNENGFSVHGIDLSDTMLESAKAFESDTLSFSNGDVRNYKIDKKFDVVISLFHVASYQTSNLDLKNYFNVANSHLQKDGIFIFDFWYGPAVLHQKPEDRVKNIENDILKVKRCAYPKIDLSSNVVEVNYEIFIENKKSKDSSIVKECHKMRYFFLPELEMALDFCGFKILRIEEWLGLKPASAESWGACIIAIKK